jgi:hypothetical protein
MYLKSGELLPGGLVRTRRPIPVEPLRQPYWLLILFGQKSAFKSSSGPQRSMR